MDQMDAGTRVSEPELDEALARAIRSLICAAIESGATENARASAS